MKSSRNRRKGRTRLVSFWAIVSLALLSLMVPRSEGLLIPLGDPQSGDGIRIISQNEKGIVLELRTSTFKSANIEADGTTYQRLTIPTYTHGLIERVGSPELPIKGYWVDLPHGMGIELQLEEVSTETSSGYLVYPVPQKIALEEEVIEEFAVDREAYGEDRFCPEERVRKGTVAYLRDQKKAQIMFLPVSFNPQSGQLRLHTIIRARITFIPDQGSELQDFGFRTAPFGLGAADPAWFPPSDHLYKITATEEGIYRISSGELAATGMDLGAIDPRNLHLYNRGTEVAMYVFGEGDGFFDPTDYLLFYAEPIDTKYTRTNVYWLVVEDIPGLRMSTVNGTPGGGEVPPDFTATFSHEPEEFYWRLAPGPDDLDRWFSGQLIWGGNSINFPLPVTEPAASGQVHIQILLWGYYEDGQNLVTATLGGLLIGQAQWQGQGSVLLEATLNQEQLSNWTLTIQSSSSSTDLALFDWCELTYERNFVATDDSLKFSSDPGYLFEISGFTDNVLSVFDITDPVGVSSIQNIQVSGGPGAYTLMFQDHGGIGEHTYIALSDSRMKTAQSITQVTRPNLADPGNGADYILITHGDIGWDAVGNPYTWLQNLSGYRQGQGLRVVAVDVDQIYDAFNYGISDPLAIKDFLGYAYHTWQPPAPQYVLLVGDATYDPKGNRLALQPGIPTYLGWAPYMGETAMDDWFAQVVGGDAIGDLYLGRLPAAHNGEAQIMIAKIMNYEEGSRGQPWQNKLLLVADDEEPVFEQTKEAVSVLVPPEYTLTKGYLSEYKISPKTSQDLTNLIIDEINQGVLIVNYAGHGSTQYWAQEKIFDANRDMPMLSNDQRLPVMVLMTCRNGYFLIPSTRSLTEQMLAANGAGAIATFASTGMNLAEPQKVLDEGFFEAIFQQGFTQLGQATNYAKQILLANFPGEQDTADTYGLMGDPAMILAMDSSPDPHTVSTPSVASGPTTGETNTSYSYTTGGSTCSHGHAVEYRFDWDDGTQSGWSTSTSASHTWAAAGTYTVRVEARCSVNNTITSNPSPGLPVTISVPHTVSTPTAPSGPTTGQPNTSYSYTTGGSTCSHGHAVESRFDWDDGTQSGWSTSTSASHTWAAAGTYTVRAEARCSLMATIVSSPSTEKMITITATPGSSGITDDRPDSPCFIATAAYGSLLDPHVDALRSFKDRWLLINPLGRSLVKTYYSLSPPAAEWIKTHENIRALTRIGLMPLVALAKMEVDRALAILLTLLLLTIPFTWIHSLTRRRKCYVRNRQ